MCLEGDWIFLRLVLTNPRRDISYPFSTNWNLGLVQDWCWYQFQVSSTRTCLLFHGQSRFTSCVMTSLRTSLRTSLLYNNDGGLRVSVAWLLILTFVWTAFLQFKVQGLSQLWIKYHRQWGRLTEPTNRGFPLSRSKNFLWLFPKLTNRKLSLVARFY